MKSLKHLWVKKEKYDKMKENIRNKKDIHELSKNE